MVDNDDESAPSEVPVQACQSGDKRPTRNFKDQVSEFAYSNGNPAQLDLVNKPDTVQLQRVGPPRKRKRSRASSPQDSDRDNSSSSPVNRIASSTPKRTPTRGKKGSSYPTSPSSSSTITSKLCDTLRPNLVLVLIGLNPGIMTANLGHPYAHPSNGFWKILFTSGITPVHHRPQDHARLPDLYGIGNTNICARPSRQGSDLTKAELLEGAKILDDKIALYRPEAACISGKGVWEAVWIFKTGKKKMPKEGEDVFQYGWQKEQLWLGRRMDERGREVIWKGTRTFVAPSTSGLNAGMSPAEKEEAWKPLGEWMRKRREERER